MIYSYYWSNVINDEDNDEQDLSGFKISRYTVITCTLFVRTSM